MSEEKCKFLLNDGNNCCALFYSSDTSGNMELPYCEAYSDCYYKQLQTAKEENERLRNLLGKPYKRRIDLENEKLTQQNKQLKEALEIITKKIHWIKKDPCLMKIKNCEKCTDKPCPINIAQQALKGVE